MRIRAVARTDLGRQRDRNEDTFAVDDRLGLYSVCDGMGGHAAGDVAASVALEAAWRTIRQRPWVLAGGQAPLDALTRLLDRAVAAANADVYALAQEYEPYRGMGCTLTMLLATPQRAALASVGDSRFYLVRQGRARQLTLDHTVGQELVAAGVVPIEDIGKHRYARLLSRAIGVEPRVRADVLGVQLAAGDRFVICTDGLSDYVHSEEQLAKLVQDGSIEEVVARLVGHANEAGGRDNITTVVGQVE